MRKKIIALIIVGLLISSLTNCSNLSNESVDNKYKEDLLLHYSFDEMEENIVKDSSGNNNDGEIEGIVTTTDDGVNGNTLSFDGFNSVKLPNELLNGVKEITIATWINMPSDTRGMSEWQRIFDLGSDASTNFFLSKNRQVEAKIMGVADNLGAGALYNNDEWVYVAVTAGNGKMAYYENGIKIKEKETDLDFEAFFNASFENYIGKSKYPSDPMMIGKVDEFRVYKKALDEEAITSVMKSDMSDKSIIDKEVSLMDIQNIKSIYKDIDLPKELNNGVKIKWTSSNKDIISNNGKVTRPSGSEGQTVTLKAELSRGKVEREEIFNVYVMPEGVASYTLNIDSNGRLFDVSDMLFGLFFEDINHGADGGLYAELIENRSFQYTMPLNEWTINDLISSEVVVKDINPLNTNNNNYLNVTVKDGEEVKIFNDGYKGITIKNGESYDLSFFARNISSNNSVFVVLEDKDENVLSDEVEIKLDNTNWKKYSTKLKANADTDKAILTLYTRTEGSYDIDMISLFPETNVNSYGLREDLVTKLKDLNPKFLRFPGGCVIEGHTKGQMYNWKNTVGNIEERKEIENLWGYSQSYGLGFYEYLLLSEELGAEPIPTLNAGMTCQGGIHQGLSDWMAEIGDELNVYIQDALDFIEYCNGDGTGEWSRLRVEAGHKEPFNIKYIGIGNEQWGPEYHKRFEEFQKVINEKYPDIVLVSAAGPVADGSVYTEAWDWINEKAQNTVVDEHYYMEPEWFLANVNRYDNFDREGAKVFIGEYASKSNTLKSAIAEAAYFTGIEKNSDVIKMASYAPLFAKYDDYQWAPDMIWFNGETSYGSANYYVQKLMGNNIGTQMLKEELEKSDLAQETMNEIFTSTSYDKETDEIIIKVVNSSGESKEVNIDINGAIVEEKATVEYITSNSITDENTFENPEKVKIDSKELEGVVDNFIYEVDKYSVNIIRIKIK